MAETRALVSKDPPQKVMQDLARQLLESSSANAVFTLRRTGQDNNYCYSLISDPALIGEACPFFPVMPVQGARALTELTIMEPLQEPVAAFLRPCEIRAFVENTKQSQGSLDNVFMVSCICPGVIPAGIFRNAVEDELIEDLENNVRNACSSCINFIPENNADMVVALASDEAADGTLIYLLSERSRTVMEGLDSLEEVDAPKMHHSVARLAERRSSKNTQLTNSVPSVKEGLESLVQTFSACIGCRACREACPLCNCVLCDYETSRTQHSPELVRSETMKRGSLRVPAGTVQFQLGRLMHISPICVSCGQCSDVCPVSIPVSDIFKRAAALVQQTLDYVPGADPEEPTPFSTYREKELSDITDK
jgi:formate dehydrogenase (coenzyme F420) beta subunit